MSGRNSESQKQRASGMRGHIAVIVALFALAVVAVAWFWITRQPAQEAGLMPHGVIAIGAGAFVTACIAYARDMDASDVLEMLGDMIGGLFSIIGAILMGIWNAILGIFGWD